MTPVRDQRDPDDALDRALSLSASPDVPVGLARRIVEQVTVLPQDPPRRSEAAPAGRRAWWSRRGALAASLAVVAALGGGTLVVQQDPAPGAVRSADASAVTAAASSRDPLPAVASVAAVPGAAPSAPHPPGDRLAPAAGGFGADSPRMASSAAAAPADHPAVRASPDVTGPGVPDDAPLAVAEPAVELDEPVSGSGGMVGPSLAESATNPGLAPDGAVYGPPAPQGMGIVGGRPSPGATPQPSGAAPAGPRGTGPARRAPRGTGP